MTPLDEVLRRGFRPAQIIHKKVIQGPRTDLFRIGFDARNADFSFKQWAQIDSRKMKEYANHAVDSSFEKTIQASPFFPGQSVGVVDEDIVPVALRAFLGSAFKSGVEGVGDVGNDASEGFGLLSPQTLSDSVWDVSEAFSRVQDFKLGNSRDRSVTDPVENERNGRLGDLSELGDIFLGGTHRVRGGKNLVSSKQQSGQQAALIRITDTY
jgi:hypothetical protein